MKHPLSGIIIMGNWQNPIGFQFYPTISDSRIQHPTSSDWILVTKFPDGIPLEVVGLGRISHWIQQSDSLSCL